MCPLPARRAFRVLPCWVGSSGSVCVWGCAVSPGSLPPCSRRFLDSIRDTSSELFGLYRTTPTHLVNRDGRSSQSTGSNWDETKWKKKKLPARSEEELETGAWGGQEDARREKRTEATQLYT